MATSSSWLACSNRSAGVVAGWLLELLGQDKLLIAGDAQCVMLAAKLDSNLTVRSEQILGRNHGSDSALLLLSLSFCIHIQIIMILVCIASVSVAFFSSAFTLGRCV